MYYIVGMTSFEKQYSKYGFTLVEILIAISIVVILGGIVLGSMNSARDVARDKKRIADIEQIELALKLYRSVNSTYPEGASGALSALSSELAPYLTTLPDDPLGDRSFPGWIDTTDSEPNAYYYWRADSIPSDCSASEYIIWYHQENGEAGNAPDCLTITDTNSYAVIK